MFRFADYTPNELTAIFVKLCHDAGMQLSPDADSAVRTMFEHLYSTSDDDFGNGRLART